MPEFVSTRRSVIRTAAWSVPAVTVATATPAFARSTTAAPNLSTSVSGGVSRVFNEVVVSPTTFNNTGTVDAKGVNAQFVTSAPVLSVKIFGVQATALGITITPSLPSSNFVLGIPASLLTVPAGGSTTSAAAQVLEFADSTPVTVQSTVTAAEGGVPYVSPTTTI